MAFKLKKKTKALDKEKTKAYMKNINLLSCINRL